jgi:hypothetical protein
MARATRAAPVSRSATTNTSPGASIFGLDQQDLYVEELNPLNPLEYRTEQGWAAMAAQRRFLVKGASARTSSDSLALRSRSLGRR